MEASKQQTPVQVGLTSRQANKLAAIPVGLAFILSLQPTTLLHSRFDFFFHGSSILFAALICFILLANCLVWTSRCILPIETAPIENRQQFSNINKIILKKSITLSCLPFIAIIFNPSFFLLDAGVFFLLITYGFLLMYSTSAFMVSELKKHPSLAKKYIYRVKQRRSIYNDFPGDEVFYNPSSPLYSPSDRY